MTLILKELKDLTFGNLDLNRRIKILNNTGILSIRLSGPFAICLLTSLLLAGTALGDMSREGLVAYYNFENNLNDLSGEGNNGQSLSPEYTEGIFGQAHLSTSPNSDVVIKDSKSLRVQNMTLLLWIKPDFSDVGDNTNVILSKELNGAAGGYLIDYQHFKTGILDVTGINFKLMEGGMSAQGYYNTLAPITLEKGKWYFIAGTFDGTTRKLYINGKLWENKCHVDGPGGSEWDDKCATNIKIFHDSTPLHIGNSADPYAPKNYWRGAIDEVRIYNRALSAEEIKTNYEDGNKGQISTITSTPTYSPSEPESSAVLLHGEKTDVVLGEDILLKLSAVNLITKPPMSVQVMIYPPSGMSVIGSEFVKSGAGIYTTTYTLNPGDGKDIEVHIKSNQVGDFNVKGRIVYYFGEDKDKAEDHTLNLPIKVRKEAGQTAPLDSTPKTPGFAGEFAIIGILFVALLLKRRG